MAGANQIFNSYLKAMNELLEIIAKIAGLLLAGIVVLVINLIPLVIIALLVVFFLKYC